MRGDEATLVGVVYLSAARVHLFSGEPYVERCDLVGVIFGEPECSLSSSEIVLREGRLAMLRRRLESFCACCVPGFVGSESVSGGFVESCCSQNAGSSICPGCNSNLMRGCISARRGASACGGVTGQRVLCLFRGTQVNWTGGKVDRLEEASLARMT